MPSPVLAALSAISSLLTVVSALRPSGVMTSSPSAGSVSEMVSPSTTQLAAASASTIGNRSDGRKVSITVVILSATERNRSGWMISGPTSSGARIPGELIVLIAMMAPNVSE